MNATRPLHGYPTPTMEVHAHQLQQLQIHQHVHRDQRDHQDPLSGHQHHQHESSRFQQQQQQDFPNNSPNPRTVLIRAIPDTGATKSVISLDLITKHGFTIDRDLTVDIVTCSGEALASEGMVNLFLTYEGHQAPVECLVSSSIKQMFLISWKDLQALGVLTADFPQPLREAPCICRVETADEDTHLKRTFSALLDEFSDVFNPENGKLKTIKGPKMHIQLKQVDRIRLIKCLTARRVPIHLEEEARKEIQSLVDQGVIIKQNDVTEWISPSFFIVKPSGALRLVTNFRRLNQLVERPVHPFPTASEISGRIPFESKVFAKFDAMKGYYQIGLDEESIPLTTFMVADLGKYSYVRAPLGLASSGDVFCQRVDAALDGLEGFMKLIDDIIIFGPNESVVFDRVRKLLQRCRDCNITLSKQKAEIGHSVKFAGFIVSAKGISPDPDKLKALRDFPIPHNVTTLRSFLGLANYLGSFIPNLSQVTSNLRSLLKKNTGWHWLEEHTSSFQETIKTLLNHTVLEHYNPNVMCELLTDASNLNGIGYALVQKDDDGRTRVIQCGSRSLSNAERNYAVVELELLAIVWAIRKCRMYLANRKFRIVSDHRPLTGLVSKTSLDYLDNRRLVNFMDKISGYDFEMVWVPGKSHCFADALSRNPVDPPEDETSALSNMVLAVTTRRQAFDTRLRELSEYAVADPVYQQIVKAFCDHVQIRKLANDHPAKTLQGIWENISLEGDLLWYDNRIIVPYAMRSKILNLLHIGHSGVNKTLDLARYYFYWPGMNNDIKQIVGRCEECQKYRASQPLEMELTSSASVPMQAVSMDLFSLHQKDYLVIVDRYSGFPWVFKLTNTNTDAIIKCFRQVIRTFGAPQSCRTDGGPQFRSAFVTFCDEWGIRHELSSPYNPRSNGLAEATVKNMKYLLAKYHSNWENFEMALLEWRNTPRQNQKSPAELMFSRKQKTLLPGSGPQIPEESGKVHSSGDPPTPTQPSVQVHRQYELLQPGDKVRVQDPHSKRWTQKGTVISRRDTGRSYEIAIYEEDGEDVEKQVLRNRRLVKKL